MSGPWQDTTLHDQSRAPRYEMRMAMRYRLAGKTEWHQAQTENISRSGVLFRVSEALQLSDLVEMQIALPLDAAAKHVAQVICRGWIVRLESPSGDHALPMIAAKILDYELVRDMDAAASEGIVAEV